MLTKKWIKIFLSVAVLMFVARPFIGFAMNRSTTPVQSILLKSFQKRKLDFIENGKFDVHAVQKKLADPVTHIFAPFLCLSALLFLFAFVDPASSLNKLIRLTRFGVSYAAPAWLLNSQFII
jgi:hypothetical protein